MSTEHNAWDTFATPTRWANRLTSRLDDSVYTVSDETRRSMSPAAAARCTTLHHGIDIEGVAALADQHAAVRSNWVSVPTSSSSERWPTIAPRRTTRTFCTLPTHSGSEGAAHVVAVGQGPLEHEIVTLRDQLGLGDFVLLTGHRADASRVMAAFDVFTLASKYEGLPVALMQALALGLPVRDNPGRRRRRGVDR